MKKLLTIVVGLLLLFAFQECSNQKTKNPLSMSSNPVTWFSIPSDDLSRTSTFYKSAFGWEIQPLTIEKKDDFSYHNVVTSESDENLLPKKNGNINGCIVKRKIGLPTPAVLVEVDDLDAAIIRIKQAGGVVVSDKITLPTLNAELVFIKDIDGNYVEVFKSLAPIKL